MLDVKGNETILSITTIEKTDSKRVTTAISLQVSPLHGNAQVNLPVVYSIDKLPVSNESIADAIDIGKWPHLRDLKLPNIDADVGLLIGSEVPAVL